ncbi:uncharacterized protein LOC115723930 [Cannabis sativa]|uniref:uncharacterized protein LOC115723930 n=1 Tax=Cannabis sativa TaxID=3483 RepID=UPI0029C9EC85|nr:uncharacterized protein LOC115723930 [Cannabis sativa]
MTQQRNPLEDPTDPYYLHHGDNPSNVLVSQLLTGQDNYMSWSRAMQLAISVKNKLGFYGTISTPMPSDSIMYNAWLRNNNIVISWILNSVSKEISSSILYDESAAAIWIDLKIRFQQRNGPHIYNLLKGLMNLKQENQSVSMYFTKLKTIWEQLSNYRPTCVCNGCTCGGVKKFQEHHHMEYIMVFHLVTQEENQKGHTNSNTEQNQQLAFAFQGDKTSINKKDTQGNKPPRKNRHFCTHCNILGHTIEKCYKIHGYPPGYGKNNKESAVNQFQTNNDTNKSPIDNQALLPQLSAVHYQHVKTA